MRTIAQRAEAYKRGTINGFKPFVESGLLTPKELDFIATGSMLKYFDQIARCEYKVSKKGN
jgi:hypothetical protein